MYVDDALIVFAYLACRLAFLSELIEGGGKGGRGESVLDAF